MCFRQEQRRYAELHSMREHVILGPPLLSFFVPTPLLGRRIKALLLRIETSLSDSNCCSEPVSYAAVEENGACGLVIEVLDDL